MSVSKTEDIYNMMKQLWEAAMKRLWKSAEATLEEIESHYLPKSIIRYPFVY